MRSLGIRLLIGLVALAAGAAALAAEDGVARERQALRLEPIAAKRLVLKKDLLEGLHTYLSGRLTEAGLYRVLPAERAGQAEVAMRVEILKLGSRCTLLATVRKLPGGEDDSVVSARSACDEDSLVDALDMIVAKLSAGEEPFLDGPHETSAPGEGPGRPPERAAR